MSPPGGSCQGQGQTPHPKSSTEAVSWGLRTRIPETSRSLLPMNLEICVQTGRGLVAQSGKSSHLLTYGCTALYSCPSMSKESVQHNSSELQNYPSQKCPRPPHNSIFQRREMKVSWNCLLLKSHSWYIAELGFEPISKPKVPNPPTP